MAGRVEAGQDSRLVVCRAGHHRHGDGHEDDAESDAGEEHAGEQVGEVAATGVDGGEQEEAGCGGGKARRHRGAHSGVGHHMAGEVDAGRERDGEREERETGLEGTGSQHVLHVERAKQEQPEQRGRRGEHHREPAADAAVGEAVDIQQRVSGPALCEHECDQAGDSGRGGAEHGGGAPACVSSLRERVHDRAEPGGGEHRAAEVESVPARSGGVCGDDPAGRDGEPDTDRDVDQEDRLPADELGQRASEEHADGGTRSSDRAPGREGVRPLATLSEGAHEDGERGGREHRGAQSLSGPCGEQRFGASCCRCGDGGEGEDAQSGHEHAARPDEVGGTAAEQEQAAEDQRVARDRPADVAAVDAEAVGHVRQRDVHGRDVEDHHELGGAEHQKQLLEAPH